MRTIAAGICGLMVGGLFGLGVAVSHPRAAAADTWSEKGVAAYLDQREAW